MLRRKIQSKIADYLENGSNKILVLNGDRQNSCEFKDEK